MLKLMRIRVCVRYVKCFYFANSIDVVMKRALSSLLVSICYSRNSYDFKKKIKKHSLSNVNNEDFRANAAPMVCVYSYFILHFRYIENRSSTGYFFIQIQCVTLKFGLKFSVKSYVKRPRKGL